LEVFVSYYLISNLVDCAGKSCGGRWKKPLDHTPKATGGVHYEKLACPPSQPCREKENNILASQSLGKDLFPVQGGIALSQQSP
jgi:hypothetical protein